MKKILFLFIVQFVFSQDIAVLKYNGGGDWYANPTALPNLAKFCNQNINTKINTKVNSVDVGSSEIFQYPFIHMTGHGNVTFSNNEIQNLKNYLSSGGFLHIDDNYGMDEYVRKEIKKIFPDKELVELPKNHQLFQEPFNFSEGLPKIHEHDNKPPKAYGIFIDKRLVLLYTYETDLGDGWENQEVHNDPKNVREKALKMGANILHFVFNN